MASCTMCGVTVPDGQSCCSMCYGDVDFGSDGYYLAWLERGLQKQAEEKALEEAIWLLESYTGRHEDTERLAKELVKAKEVLGDEV